MVETSPTRRQEDNIKIYLSEIRGTDSRTYPANLKTASSYHEMIHLESMSTYFLKFCQILVFKIY